MAWKWYLEADMCQDPKKIRDPGSPGSRIEIKSDWNQFDRKKRSKTGKIQFLTVLAKKSQIFFDFHAEARSQILVICNLYESLLLKISIFCFWVPHCNFKKLNGPCGQFVSEFEFFEVRFGISVPKDIKMGGVAIASPKRNGDHNPAYRSNSSSQREALSLNLCNIRSCFANIICRREVQLVSLCSQYMS